jgi:pimeloyl-ACP methyl ester carboxylesterase
VSPCRGRGIFLHVAGEDLRSSVFSSASEGGRWTLASPSWLTGTGASAARWYWEFGRAQAAARAAGQAPPAVSVPVGFTTFPGEIWAAPRSWVETVYSNLTYFNEVDSGGHFPAWEEPELFAGEVRAAFRSLY